MGRCGGISKARRLVIEMMIGGAFMLTRGAMIRLRKFSLGQKLYCFLSF
jgi:hypothetical protein